MPLSRGTLLGPYRIDAEIGAGGMGHVFRATDTRLDRAVAIKVLPANRWADPELRARFEREARALSSLSHPNLCALYDVGETTQGGATAPYLVMELLEGETLRERLVRSGPLPVRKALSWAAQIASGLAAAHQKGVVHRDLKPENIHVVNDDLLKILDFGLARDVRSTEPASPYAKTETGFVMGTAEYMSPEQARGRPVGPESDIFALGTLLFELLTGRVPFQAPSTVETMNAILIQEPPDLRSLNPEVPDGVDHLVRRCLEKDPSQRFSSARDLAFALESAARGSSQRSIATRKTSRIARAAFTRRRIGLAVGGLLLLLAALLATRAATTARAPDPPRLQALTHSGRDSAPAASPDGRIIAYVSSRDGTRSIWLKQLADGTEAAITAGPDDAWPRFSPDGASILFTRSSGGTTALYRVAVVGGEPRKLLDDAFHGDWSPDGTKIAFIRHRTGESRLATLCVARVDGGGVEEIYATADDEITAPRWSPSGEWIAVTSSPRSTLPGRIVLVDPQSRAQRVLSHEPAHGRLSSVAWATGGAAVVYVELDALASVGMPQQRGSSSVILHPIGRGTPRVLLRYPHSAADTIDIAGEGRLVFSEDVTRQNLQEIALDGEPLTRWLSRGTSVDRQPAYTADGKRLVFTSSRGGNVDIWELALDNGRLRRLTDDPAVDWDPHPARDGRGLYWSSNRGGHFEIWHASNDGANPRQVTRDGVDAENPSLPADGSVVLYDSSNPKGDGLWRIPSGGGAPILVRGGETIHPEISFDGRYAVYQRPERDGTASLDVVDVATRDVYPFVSKIDRVGALRPRWIGATHEIAFRAAGADGRIALHAQPFIPGADTNRARRVLTRSASDALLETYAIAPDGRRAVLSIVDEASSILLADGVEGVRR